MQIVIEIPEEDYKGICNLKNEQLQMLPEEVAETLVRIANGTPLPKGHGRLIDADALWKKWVFDAIGKQEIDEAPTIIEADKAEMEVTQALNEFSDNLEESENK